MQPSEDQACIAEPSSGPSCSNRERCVRMRWLIGGTAFGLLFPLIGWLIAAATSPADTLRGVHSNQPVLYVVDLAPLILGATGYGLGVFHSRLIRIRHSIEETVEARTAELSHALQDLAATQAELLNSQKMEAIGGLAAGIAHEINTPIQYVSDNTRFVEESLAGLIEVAAAAESLVGAVKDVGEVAGLVQTYEQVAKDADIEFLAEEIPSALEESLEGIGQVASIVKALKSFAHPGSTDKSPEDLNEIITTTVAVSRNEWKYVADMDLSGLDQRLPKVPVIAGPLKQVILNIVVNAAHAIESVSGTSGEMGSITIATAIEGTTAVIRISDSGGGIPERVRDRIMEPFFTTKDVGKGSGQGLAIAQSIVDNHGGDLSFDSTMNQGTTFTIALPLETQATTETEEALASA